MRLRLLPAAFACAAALVAAPVVWAEVVDRYPVASDPDARGYPPSLEVVLPSPPDYVRGSVGRLGNDGTWRGPRYQATGRPSLGGNASIDWSAGIERYAATRASILSDLVHDWAPISGGTKLIERRVAGRRVGMIRGVWLLTRGTPMAGAARYEAGMVIPLCGRTARVHFAALTPADDSAGGAMGFGEYTIEGAAPSAWNREQLLDAVYNVRVEGNLPARRITTARRPGAIAGIVTDCNRHPLAGQTVSLERQSGASWKRVAAGKTSATGVYSLRAGGAGTYRVIAGDRRSAVVRIG
jgi:hypothetical protein